MHKPLEKFDLSGKVIIITGGAGLLGNEYTFALAQAGARVVVADLDIRSAQQIAAEAKEQSGQDILAVELDVTSKPSVEKMAQKALKNFGRIDGLVNNAALDPKFDKQHIGQQTNSFENYPLELWNQGLAVNLTGMFLCAQAVAPTMLAQRQGVIVNICSIYGLVGPDQRLYESDDPTDPVMYKPVIYSVSKSAVIGFSRYLATYWAGKGIRVNTLTLGGVYNNHDKGFVRRYSERMPLGRMADKSEYNGALLFLLSDASSYMTGANLIVDGGWTAW